jgi:hypothetical protein
MFGIPPLSTENCIGLKVSDQVTAEDCDGLLPVLNQAIAARGHPGDGLV